MAIATRHCIFCAQFDRSFAYDRLGGVRRYGGSNFPRVGVAISCGRVVGHRGGVGSLGLRGIGSVEPVDSAPWRIVSIHSHVSRLGTKQIRRGANWVDEIQTSRQSAIPDAGPGGAPIVKRSRRR